MFKHFAHKFAKTTPALHDEVFFLATSMGFYIPVGSHASISVKWVTLFFRAPKARGFDAFVVGFYTVVISILVKDGVTSRTTKHKANFSARRPSFLTGDRAKLSHGIPARSQKLHTNEKFSVGDFGQSTIGRMSSHTTIVPHSEQEN